jgi:hypothetical protein
MKSSKGFMRLFVIITFFLALVILGFSTACKQKEETPASDVKEKSAGTDVNTKPAQKTGNPEEQAADLTQKAQPADQDQGQSSQEKNEREITEPDASNGKSIKNEAEGAANPPAEPVLLARVNDAEIYSTDLEGKPLDAVINQEILYQAGLKQGLDVKLKDEIEHMKKRIITNEVENEILADVPNKRDYTDKELEDYYNEHLKDYQFLTFSEISVNDGKLAEEIHKKAIAGESFDDIASDLSKSGVKVGTKNIGFTRKYGNLFDSYEVGSVSEAFPEGDSFKVLKILQVKTIPLNLVKRNIILAVNNQKKVEALRSKIDQLKKENGIEVTIFSNGGTK